MTASVAAGSVVPDVAGAERPGEAGREPRLPDLVRRWVFRDEPDAERMAALGSLLNLPPVLCRLLVTRGHGSPDDARAFLKPRLDMCLDPLRLAGMRQAVGRVVRAIEARETILVHGDYDVDGVCSTALLTRVLRGLGARVEPFVPHRLRDGYDLTEAGIQAAVRVGARLIITADCGTVAHAPVRSARGFGIDVVITDHHTAADTLPDAVTVVNPNRPDCEYPDKRLAGVGVAFKLSQAVVAAVGGDVEALWYYLDLVALATIADLAPLAGENRVFARYGLRVLEQTRNPGLRALIRSAGLAGGPISAGQVSHVLAPRINAGGRMGEAARGVRLLLTEDEAEAAQLAEELEAENRTRRAVDRATLHEALSRLESEFDPERDYGVVLAAENWHAGVIGIVASRVVERIHRPTVLISMDPATGRGRGSARSIPKFHLYDAIHACAGTLERYGGHRQAAGLEVLSTRLAEFTAAFNRHAASALEPEDWQPRVSVDAEVELREVTPELFGMLRHFGPFGIGNAAPTLLARSVSLARPMRIVGEGHARVVLAQGAARLNAIGFGMAERVAELGTRPFDVLFQLQEDRRTGAVQARLVDVRAA